MMTTPSLLTFKFSYWVFWIFFWPPVGEQCAFLLLVEQINNSPAWNSLSLKLESTQSGKYSIICFNNVYVCDFFGG